MGKTLEEYKEEITIKLLEKGYEFFELHKRAMPLNGKKIEDMDLYTDIIFNLSYRLSPTSNVLSFIASGSHLGNLESIFKHISELEERPGAVRYAKLCGILGLPINPWNGFKVTQIETKE